MSYKKDWRKKTVKLKETYELLKIIKMFVPNFELGDEKTAEKRIEVWNEVLGNMTFEEAKRHVITHFRESEFPPKPYDILKRVEVKDRNVTSPIDGSLF